MKNIPKRFFDKLEKIYSKNDIEIVKKWFNCDKKIVSFRVNHLKSNSIEVEKLLKENNLNFQKLEYLNDWYILVNWKEKDLWDLDFYKEWKIYLQSISSQIPVLTMGLEKNKRVLDVTSAPWSKTSQIADILGNSWEIIANELNAIRIEKLKFTLNRQWVKNTKVIKNDARKLNEVLAWEKFDYILADLPCSAEWRFKAKIEKSFWFWKQEVVENNAKLQKEILENIVPLLDKNWTLVYSTCTISPEENEEVVEFILNKFSDLQLAEVKIDFEYSRDWITEFNFKKYLFDTKKVKRFLPSELSEWFFIAKFIKK